MQAAVLIALFLVFAPRISQAQETPPVAQGEEQEVTFEQFMATFDWQTSGAGKLGTRAEIDIPLEHRFLDGRQASRMLEAMGNISSNEELGLLGEPNLDWFVVFFFDDVGYVNDDEQDDLDADAMAERISNNLLAGNDTRRARGMEELFFDGWAMEPRFNDETKQLEWATRLRSDSGVSVNFNTRVLGRKGVMRTVLVTDPDRLETYLPAYRRLMDGFRFVEGERYAEYRPGDKIAEYGLIALVAGGAGAVAAKTGLLAAMLVFFKKGFKFILVALVAIGAGIKQLFTGRRNA